MTIGHRTTGAATAVLAIAALAACGSVHTNQSPRAGTSPAAAAIMRPAVADSCPGRLPTRLTSDVSGTTSTLEPLKADQLLLCGYDGALRGGTHPAALSEHRLVTDRSTIDRLRSDLNGLGPVPRGRFACPFDSGARVIAIFTDGAHEVQLRDAVSGCATVTNGSLTRWVGSSQVNTTVQALLHHTTPDH
jgi:hypothetical protein